MFYQGGSKDDMKYVKTTLIAAAAMTALGVTAAKADIKIAVAGPMTAQYATFGEQMKAGGTMAVKDINAAGGVLGQKLILSIEDDACDPKQAVAVANKVVSEGVVFMAGHFCSGSSIPASKVYTEEGLLQISPASTNPKLTEEGGPNVFRTCGRDDQQGIIAGNYLADNFADKKVAFLHDKTAYGKGLADETLKQYRARGKAHLEKNDIHYVVNMRIEYDDAEHGLAPTHYCYLPTVDDKDPSFEHLDQGGDALSSELGGEPAAGIQFLQLR